MLIATLQISVPLEIEVAERRGGGLIARARLFPEAIVAWGVNTSELQRCLHDSALEFFTRRPEPTPWPEAEIGEEDDGC